MGDEAMVLLAEKDNPNSLAYLSFSPDQINELYAPLRAAAGDDAKWQVTAFPLGLVWYDLLENPPTASGPKQFVANGIEYLPRFLVRFLTV